MTKFRLVIFLVILPLSLSFAQNILLPETSNSSLNAQSGFINDIGDDLSSMCKVGIGFVESPLHFDSEDLILTGIIIGATTVSTSIDNPVRNVVRNSQNPTFDKITPLGEEFGNPKYGTALSVILYLGGHILQDKEIRKTGLMLTEAMFLNGVITQGLKIVTGRSRPYSNEGNFDIHFLKMEFVDRDYSFPSGHTSTAFTFATVLSERIGNIYASIALYSLAGLTAFQRIYSDSHWISDTIVSAALGTVIGLKVIKLNSEYENENSDTSLNIVPLINRAGYGVSLALSF